MSDTDTPTVIQNSHELGSRHAATDLTSYTQVPVSVMTFTFNGFLLKHKTGTTPMALWQWKTSVLLENIYQAATVISDERTLSMNSDSLEAQNNKPHSVDAVHVCDTAGEKQSGTCLVWNEQRHLLFDSGETLPPKSWGYRWIVQKKFSFMEFPLIK